MNGSVKWNRREFTVAPNGYFNVLKANGWFAAFRLPVGFRYRFGKVGTNQVRLNDPGDPRSMETLAGQETGIELRQVDVDRGRACEVLRAVVLALTGMVLTYELLAYLSRFIAL